MTTEEKTVKLPSGKTARVRKGKGKDLLAAQRSGGDAGTIQFALLAALVLVDDAPIVLEDLLEMELEDVLALQMAVAGNFPLAPPGT